jgi:hypothetical protein
VHHLNLALQTETEKALQASKKKNPAKDRMSESEVNDALEEGRRPHAFTWNILGFTWSRFQN